MVHQSFQSCSRRYGTSKTSVNACIRRSARCFLRRSRSPWIRTHRSILNGLIDRGLELWADLPSLGRRYMVIVPSGELEHDRMPARSQSELAAVDKEEVQRCCWTYSWAGRKSYPLSRRVRYGRTSILAVMVSRLCFRTRRSRFSLPKMRRRIQCLDSFDVVRETVYVRE